VQQLTLALNGDPRPPLLKWAGGKRWLVPQMEALWAPHRGRRLVEPFVGSMAIALGLQPRRALLNDTNPHLINFYCWLQKGLMIDIAMANDRDLYYRHRERFNELIRRGEGDSQEAAELFYYLNRTCYNGLCRFNTRGEFNVPFGRYKTINYTEDFRMYKEILADWELTSGDFTQIAVQADDFIYADPPYDVEFTNYSPGGFSWEDQVRLAEWLARHPGPVVASNQATPRVMDLYRRLGFATETVEAPRRISCTGDRTPAPEMVAVKGTGGSAVRVPIRPPDPPAATEIPPPPPPERATRPERGGQSSPGSTATGSVLESMLLPVLAKNGYVFQSQVVVGTNLGGGKHRVDVLVETPKGATIPISLKWQQVKGTAEQKVPYEIINLIRAIKAGAGRFPYAYLVIGGMGWSGLKQVYLSHELRDYIRDYNLVRIVSLEDFIARANRKAL
jgi:DNA adenine methylase